MLNRGGGGAARRAGGPIKQWVRLRKFFVKKHFAKKIKSPPVPCPYQVMT